MTETSADTLEILPRPLKKSKPQQLSSSDELDRQLREETTIFSNSMIQNPRIQRYLVAFEYIGTLFFGSQKQPNHRTVVGVLEEAFRKFIGQPVSVVGSSRTDTGVHALSSVFHVDLERTSKRKPGEVLPPHEPAVVKRAVNHFLQREGDIMLIDVRTVSSDFHARYKAQERTYFYRLLSGPELLSTFEKDRAWHIPEELNIVAMQGACKVLVGDHDFSSFRAAGCQAKSPIRTLDELHVSEVPTTPYFPSQLEREREREDVNLTMNDSHGESNDKTNMEFGVKRKHRCYVVTARSRSFLYHQVRLLVGAIKAVGTGDITVSDVERILHAKTVSCASPMAPSCGLYLGQVKYDLP